jgi:hypothetical protein
MALINYDDFMQNCSERQTSAKGRFIIDDFPQHLTLHAIHFSPSTAAASSNQQKKESAES